MAATPLAQLRRRVGDLRQLGRVDAFVEADGAARGSRRLRLVTGGGLEVEVHPDRCLDLGAVTYRGMPLTWRSPAGAVGPALVEPTSEGWRRGFGGGLLATCGLDTFGAPSLDAGEDLPLHGRVGALPADEVAARTVGAADGTLELVVEGVVRQSRLFGEDLELRRRISAPFGGTRVTVEDTVRNLGHTAAPHMLLYHCNLGWPLLDGGCILDVPGSRVHPRDDAARAGLASWSLIGAPTQHWAEQVFRHELPPVDDATAPAEQVVSLRNPRLEVELRLAFDRRTLPALFQWTMTGEGTYVLGLEPANCPVIEGRATARARGLLPVLAPGESTSYRLTWSVHELGTTST